jgi:hypothetical protein
VRSSDIAAGECLAIAGRGMLLHLSVCPILECHVCCPLANVAARPRLLSIDFGLHGEFTYLDVTSSEGKSKGEAE